MSNRLTTISYSFLWVPFSILLAALISIACLGVHVTFAPCAFADDDVIVEGDATDDEPDGGDADETDGDTNGDNGDDAVNTDDVDKDNDADYKDNAGNDDADEDGQGEGDAPEQPAGPQLKPTKAGWMKDSDGSWYYFASAASAPSTGWIRWGGAWYYLDPAASGKMATGRFSVGSESYVCGSSGAMATGWVKLSEGWYYAASSGALRSGWLHRGAWYWLQPDKGGLMAEGQWVTDNGSDYYLAPGSGAMATGWVKLPEGWYFTSRSGAKQKGGWVHSGAWYWLQADKDGLMIAGTIATLPDGKTYSFAEGGAMRASCVVDMGEGRVGYASASGAISQVGVRENGKLVLKGAKGEPLTGWQKIGGAWFYGDQGGQAHTGWLQLGGSWYWLDSDGVMATGVRTIDGKRYVFSGSGLWLPVSEAHMAVFQRALAELERCTNASMTMEQKLWAAYVHVRDDFREYNPRTPHMRRSGWEVIYADDVFIGRGGNCLSYAAALAFMAKAIGYENVYACNRGHAWVEINGRVYDPEWEKNHRSENYFNRPINAKGGPGYTDQCPADSPWMRVAI